MLQSAYVFISYRSFERDIAARLACDLRNAGVGVWMDALDAGIQVGDVWPRRLEEAIDQCAGLVCVLSPDYVASEYRLRELHRADTRGVPLVPLLLRPLRDTKVPIELERTQYIDFERWQDPKFYDRQYQQLEAELQRKLSPIFGSKPDRETQYLNDLTADLSRAMGVLEYTELATQVVNPGLRPQPWPQDEWGYSLLAAGATAPANEKREYSSIGEILQAHPRLVLVGAPGAGKSTTLRRIARDAAFARRERPRSSPLPLMLNLAQWRPALGLHDFVSAHWPFQSDPIGAISAGDVSLFLDGLNEMGEAGERNASQLRDWLDSPDGPKTLVVTCRANDYAGPLSLGDLPTVLVKELQPEQIVLFARRYLQDTAPAFLQQLGIDPDGAGNFDRGLLALARNPYFLRSLIELFILSGSKQLPRNSGALLHRLTQALWQREQQRRTKDLVPLATFTARCARLARAIMDEGKPLQVQTDYAVRHSTRWFEFAWRRRAANHLFHSAVSAGLMSVDAAGVRFSHQLVQEYFAALSFIDPSGQPDTKQLENWRPTRRSSQMPTFVALCGLVQQADDLVRLFFSWDVLYAGQCLASGVTVSPKLRDEIVAGLIAVIRARPASALGPDYRGTAAAEALGLIGEIGAEGTTALGALLMRDDSWSRDSPAIALSRLRTEAAALELHHAVGKLRADNAFLASAEDDYLIDRLGEMGAIAIPELISTLDQPPPVSILPQQPRDSAVRALRRVGEPAVPALLVTLQIGSNAAKAGSAEVLGQLGVVAAVPYLVDGLVTPVSGWSALHNKCLGAFKALGDSAIPNLAVELESPVPERRLAGVKAMGAIGTTASIPYLLHALEDVDTVRKQARHELSLLGAPAVPPLLEFLTSASPVGVAAAARTLGWIKDTRALPALRALLSARDDIVRWNAAFALGNIADSSVASDLFPLLQDKNPGVAEAAAWSLGELKHESAVDPLIRCLTERGEERLRKQTALSLEKIGGQPAFEAAMRYWREALSQTYHTYDAGEALGRMRDASAVPLLIQATQQGPEFARSSYIKALGLIGDRSAVPAIIERLHDRNVISPYPLDICASAIEALGQMKDTQAIGPLTEWLNVTERYQNGRICDLSAKALQSIGTSESIALAGEHWRTALADANVGVRLLAAETLAELKYEPATEELTAALSRQEETGYYDKRNVADSAAAALELIGSPAALAAVRDYWQRELSSTRTRGRVLAIQGLGRLGRESDAQLIALLSDTDWYNDRYVADYAADVLKASSSPEARLALAKYFTAAANPSSWI